MTCWRWCTVLSTCFEVFLHRKAWPWSWIEELCHLLWILFAWFGDRAIFWFFLYKAWHCGRPSPSILLTQQSNFVYFCRLVLHPCSSSLLPSELYVLARLVSGNFFHKWAGMVTCRCEFCKLSCMPKVHQVACPSSLSASHWLFSTGCFSFVYLKFLPDHLSKGGKGCQCCALLQAPSKSFGRSY